MSRQLYVLARKISKKVGTSKATSYRIAKKLNTLAASVDWAEPVGNDNGVKGPMVACGLRSRKVRSRKQSPRPPRGRSRAR